MFIPRRAASALLRAVLATTLLSAGLVGLAQGVVATAAELAEGSELVVTDRHGDHLIGYGRVERGELRLALAEHDGDGLAVIVIDPEGRMSTLVGRFAADGLRVLVPGTEQDVTLASWLSERGVRLTLDPVRARDDDREIDRDDDDDDRDGDRGEAPGDDPSDDGDDADDGDDDGDDDRDDDGDDGDDDADDADDGDDDRDDDADGDDDGDDADEAADEAAADDVADEATDDGTDAGDDVEDDDDDEADDDADDD